VASAIVLAARAPEVFGGLPVTLGLHDALDSRSAADTAGHAVVPVRLDP
jgi:hypothetical protein